MRGGYRKRIFTFFTKKYALGCSNEQSYSYVVGTQKNRLNETVLLSNQNIFLD